MTVHQAAQITADRPATGRPVVVEDAPPSRTSGGFNLALSILEGVVTRLQDTGASNCADLSPDAQRDVLTELMTGIRSAATGTAIRLKTISTGVAVRDLLDAIRRGFLEELRTSPGMLSADAMVQTLWAIERVQAEAHQDDARRFVNRFSGADSLGLLIEVAHDMRSPLNAILFLTEQIRSGRSGPVSPIQERQMGLVYGAAFGLSALASDVIELAHGGSRLIDRTPLPFSVSAVLASVGDIVHPIAEEKRLAMRMAGPDADVRLGHPVALSRVLLNLTTNALKFTEHGMVEVLCESRSPSLLEFMVRDTGRGIPPNVLRTLFDAFRTRHNRDDFGFSSAGLGLAISRKLVSEMGGELKVRTELGKGTCFSFELELAVAPRITNASL